MVVRPQSHLKKFKCEKCGKTYIDEVSNVSIFDILDNKTHQGKCQKCKNNSDKSFNLKDILTF